MDVSRHGFAPKRQIRCQENLFCLEEDLISFAVQIEQFLARLDRCKTAMSDPLPAVHPYPCGSILWHDFRVPAPNLRLLFHALILQANPTTFIAFFSIPALL
jgi:hypothetical protein